MGQSQVFGMLGIYSGDPESTLPNPFFIRTQSNNHANLTLHV